MSSSYYRQSMVAHTCFVLECMKSAKEYSFRGEQDAIVLSYRADGDEIKTEVLIYITDYRYLLFLLEHYSELYDDSYTRQINFLINVVKLYGDIN